MLASFAIHPVGDGESLAKPVADVVKLIQDSGLKYQLNSMATVIEGAPEKVFELLQKCHAEMKKSHHRINSSIQIDDRGDTAGQITEKVEAVEQILKEADAEVRRL